MNLDEAVVEKEYQVREIDSTDEELKSFLFTLGCYPGENITVVTRERRNLTVAIKDARYNIDHELAQCILLF